MNNELMMYSTGSLPVPRHKRNLVRQAQQLHEEAQLTAFMADAAMAVGAHIMDGVKALDQRRRDLAGDDIGLNMLLSGIEADTVGQVRAIQNGLYNGWGF